MGVGRLFCCDTVMVDLVLPIAELPPRGGDVLADALHVVTGGGFNAMSAAARLGASVLYAGRLGTGPFSDAARADLAREGVVAPIAPDLDHDLGTCVVLVEPDGERTFVTAKGAEDTLVRAHLDGLDAHGEDVVLVSGYNVMYPGLAEDVLGWLEALAPDVVVAFDPATRVSDIPSVYLTAMLARTDWLLVNSMEARALVGLLEDESHLAASVAQLARRGAVVRTGERGCFVAERDAPVEAVSGIAVDVVDLNGAGDVHNGVFLASLLEGVAPLEAARRANVAAGFSITRLGPANAPTPGEWPELWP